MRVLIETKTGPIDVATLPGDPAQVMKQLIAKRYPVYAEADVTVESRDVPHDVMVGAVIDAIAVKLGYRSKTARRRKKAK